MFISDVHVLLDRESEHYWMLIVVFITAAKYGNKREQPDFHSFSFSQVYMEDASSIF